MNYTPLQHKEFEAYCVLDHALEDGRQVIFRFPNDFGASVAKHLGTYGHGYDLFELAVIRFASDDNDDWDICVSTDITHDVEGHLSNDDVLNLLNRILLLDSNGHENIQIPNTDIPQIEWRFEKAGNYGLWDTYISKPSYFDKNNHEANEFLIAHEGKSKWRLLWWKPDEPIKGEDYLGQFMTVFTNTTDGQGSKWSKTLKAAKAHAEGIHRYFPPILWQDTDAGKAAAKTSTDEIFVAARKLLVNLAGIFGISADVLGLTAEGDPKPKEEFRNRRNKVLDRLLAKMKILDAVHGVTNADPSGLVEIDVDSLEDGTKMLNELAGRDDICVELHPSGTEWFYFVGEPDWEVNNQIAATNDGKRLIVFMNKLRGYMPKAKDRVYRCVVCGKIFEGIKDPTIGFDSGMLCDECDCSVVDVTDWRSDMDILKDEHKHVCPYCDTAWDDDTMVCPICTVNLQESDGRNMAAGRLRIPGDICPDDLIWHFPTQNLYVVCGVNNGPDTVSFNGSVVVCGYPFGTRFELEDCILIEKGIGMKHEYVNALRDAGLEFYIPDPYWAEFFKGPIEWEYVPTPENARWQSPTYRIRYIWEDCKNTHAHWCKIERLSKRDWQLFIWKPGHGYLCDTKVEHGIYKTLTAAKARAQELYDDIDWWEFTPDEFTAKEETTDV